MTRSWHCAACNTGEDHDTPVPLEVLRERLEAHIRVCPDWPEGFGAQFETSRSADYLMSHAQVRAQPLPP